MSAESDRLKAGKPGEKVIFPYRRAGRFLKPPSTIAETELALFFPKKITRYVIAELFKVFVVSLIAFVGLMILVGVAQEAMKKGLDPASILRLVPYILPEALMFAMPATILFSTCVVFGRLASENELIAIRSLGVPVGVTIAPVLIVTFFVSLFGVWLNEIAFTWSYYGVERVALESVEPVIYNVLKTQKNFSSDEITITVQDVQDDQLISPRITIYRGKGKTINLQAASGSLKGDPTDHSLIISLTAGTVQVDDQAKLTFSDTITQRVPLVNPEDARRMARNPAHTAMGRIPAEVNQQEIDILALERSSSVLAASQLFTGNFAAMNNMDWQRSNYELSTSVERLGRLRFVPYRRWANGFSCFCFVIVGIPIAMRMKNADYATTFGVCFLPVLLLYYPLFMFGMDGARSGRFPPYAVWLSNVVCIAIGAWAIRKEFKD